MRPLILLSLLLFTSFDLKQTDTDFIDVYKLTIGKCKLFVQFDTFITLNGLPIKLTIGNKDFEVKTKDEIIKLIKSATEPNVVISLKYQGFEMWYTKGDVVPFTIDLRKTEPKINYGDIAVFDKNFSLTQYNKLFPNSTKNKLPPDLTLFKTITGETGKQVKSFMLLRKSKEDENAQLTVEFTFENDKLIFICFMNVN